MTQTIILTTGGTGGHIFPARALAEDLVNQGFEVIILGDENYSKYHKKDDKFSFKIIKSSQIRKSPIALLKAGLKIKFGALQAFLFIMQKKPQVIVSFGGYATFPVLAAAVVLNKKIILHEQNAHLGKVNRLFARYANKIALTYKKTDGIKNEFQSKAIVTGNPLREEIIALSKLEYTLPNPTPQIPVIDNLGYDVILASEFYKKEELPETFNILVIGGSGGARIFSEILPKAFFNLSSQIKDNIFITQQCRADLVSSTLEQYKSFNLSIKVSHFFEDMAQEIFKAHLVIARSGSTSLAELTCARRPMILIPFAAAADNHQEKNANAIAEKGGAIVIKEQDFTINHAKSVLEKLISNETELKKMSDNAFKCANIEATQNLIKLIKNV